MGLHARVTVETFHSPPEIRESEQMGLLHCHPISHVISDTTCSHPPTIYTPLWCCCFFTHSLDLLFIVPSQQFGAMHVENQPPRGSTAAAGEVELTLPNNDVGVDAGADAGLSRRDKLISLVRLFFSCTVIGGIQYGWALQLSLLTPYAQSLGVSHRLSGIIWVCGPLAGLVVQPCVGVWSDRCTSRLGRRRPFIIIGCFVICVSVLLISFSSDIGYFLGDKKKHCSVYQGIRPRAILVYVLGFWMLDFSNNTVQGPARALMADLSGHHGTSTANAIFSLWMALGSILGYASGASGAWGRWFPFLFTKACCKDCADLKGAFLFAIILIILCMTVTMIVAKEDPLPDSTLQDKNGETKQGLGLIDIFKSLKDLPSGMYAVLLVTALTWFSWFPFTLFNTDWMGREVYYGKPQGTIEEEYVYNKGVREGAFGLLLNAFVLAGSSFLMAPLCRKVSPRLVWVFGNIILAFGLLATSILTVWSKNEYDGLLKPDVRVKSLALAVFALFGIPLSVLYSIPFAFTAHIAASEGGGQGKCTGILNVSVVIPQMIVSFGCGQLSKLFKHNTSVNLPIFVFSTIFAFIASITGFIVLPKLSGANFKAVASGGH